MQKYPFFKGKTEELTYFIQFIANILYKAPEIYIDPNNKFSD